MKYHVLVYDGNKSENTMQSLEAQEIKKLDVEVHHLDSGKETFKRGPLYAYYTEIMQIPDSEVVVLLKGGDSFAHTSVLLEINRLYQEQNALVTYGGGFILQEGKRQKDAEIPLELILSKRAREMAPRAMNLMTFYAGCFKKIKLNDLLVGGFFPEEDTDLLMMLPMLEQAEERAIHSKDILYLSDVKGNNLKPPSKTLKEGHCK